MRLLRPISAGLLLTTLVSGLLPTLSQPASAAIITNPSSSANQHTILVDNDDYQILTSGQPLTGLSIQPVTDQDIVYIDASAGQTITVAMQRTSSDRALNGTLTLADPTGAIIARDDNSGGEGNPFLAEISAPVSGRYAIQVQDYSGTRTGTYQITATVAEPLVPAASHSILDLETDPCPAPMTGVALPELAVPAIGPKNASFDIPNQELPRTNYPLNCEFARDRQLLATAITPSSFTIQNANQSQITDAFVVDPQAQYLSFDYIVGRKTADTSTPLTVEVLSGPTFTTVTDISQNTIRGQYLDGWKRGTLSVDTFRGQTIKLRFVNDSSSAAQPSAHVQNLKLSIEVPDWQPSAVGTTAIEFNDVIGAHAVITGASTFLISAPFTIPMQTQTLSFNYQTGRRLSNASAPISVQVLSGPDFATTTAIDSNRVIGRFSDGWKRATLDIQAFRGQVIKLKVMNDWWPNEPQTSFIDSFRLNQAVPGWDVTNTNYVSIETLQLPPSVATNVLTNTDFEHGFTPLADVIPNETFDLPSTTLQTLSHAPIILNGTNAVTTTAAIVVPEHATSMYVDAVIGDSSNPSLIKPVTVAILSGDTFDIREVPLDNQLRGATQTGTQTAVIDIKRYQGKTIKLQFTNHATNAPISQFSNFRLVDHVPSWVANSQPRLKLINETSAHPTHAYLAGTQSSVVSPPFTVPAEAQQVRFEYRTGHTDNTTRQSRIQLTVLSGPDFGIRTRIDNSRLVGTDTLGWQQIAFDLQRFQGTTIQLEWMTDLTNQPYLRLDNLQVGVAMAGWDGSEAGDILIEPTTSTLGQSIRLHGNKTSITSQPWTVLSTTVSLSFDYKVLKYNETGNANLYVYALSGKNFEIITRLDANTLVGSNTTPNNGWQQATLNMAQFQGRTIKLQFKNSIYTSSRSWIDSITINQGQASASHGPDVAPDGSFLTLLNSGTAQSAVSSSFVVPTDTHFLRFEYQTGTFDNGSDGRKFVVDILSGSNFATVTTINQSLPSRALNDGWHVAQLPISQFQGQTIKIRLTMPFSIGRSVVRVDKLALLSPRATLTTPIVVTGTTYLNLPDNDYGNITTTATLTINSMMVYDEYLDLNGSVHYNNTTLPFELTGDLYHSMIGDKNDKVADLIDKTNTVDSIYFSANKLSPASHNIEHFNFYIQRKGTREVTFINAPFTPQLETMIDTILQVKGQFTQEYYVDYWMNNLFDPQVEESNTDPSAGTMTVTKGYSVSLKRRIILSGGGCNVYETAVVSSVMTQLTEPSAKTIHQFRFTINFANTYTKGYDAGGSDDWTNYCRLEYDSDTSSITLGSKPESPVKNKWIRSITMANAGINNGQFMNESTFESSEVKEEEPEEPTDIIDIGFTFGKVFWKWAAPGPLRDLELSIDFAKAFTLQAPAEYKRKPKYRAVMHYDHLKNPKDPFTQDPDYKTLFGTFDFNMIYLANLGDYVTTSHNINHWYGARSDTFIKVYWNIPVISNAKTTKNEPADVTKSIVIEDLFFYKSGQ